VDPVASFPLSGDCSIVLLLQNSFIARTNRLIVSGRIGTPTSCSVSLAASFLFTVLGAIDSGTAALKGSLTALVWYDRSTARTIDWQAFGTDLTDKNLGFVSVPYVKAMTVIALVGDNELPSLFGSFLRLTFGNRTVGVSLLSIASAD
jgi:hypothetical protein